MAESNNRYRLSKLLTDGGTYFAKELLKIECSNSGFIDINAFLNDATMKRRLHRLHTQPRKILHQSQMDLLYPASGTAKIDDLDITILTCILTNCFKLSASKQTTIEELRTIRNELYGHTASYQLDDNTFKQQWQRVASFLESESNTYLSPDCVKTITDMRKTIEGEILTHDLADKLFREIRMQHENQFHQISAEMSTMNTKLDAMREGLKQMAKSDRKFKHEVRSYRYPKLQLLRKGIFSKHKNEESLIFEEEICEQGLLYNDFDQQFMEAKIVEATAKIQVVKKYEKQAVDIGELMYKNRREEFVHTLKRNRILVLVGLPGSGKTFSALSIMSEFFIKENVKPIVVRMMSEFKKVMNKNQKHVILVDDVLGQYALDRAVLNEWNGIADLLLEHIRSSNSYFIFTMRRSIYQSAKSNYVLETISKNAVVIIDDKTFMKDNLLQFYARRKGIALSQLQRDYILGTKQFIIGFPVLCSHMDGTLETIIELFRSPYIYIEQEIQALCDNGDPQYAILLLCLLQGNKLNTQHIDKVLLDAIGTTDDFKEENKMQCIVDSLIGTFLGRDGDNISFLHDCIIESALKVCIQASRKVLISHLPFEYIKYLCSILKTEIVQPYKDIHKEIFPSLAKERGKEFLTNVNSATFFIRELGEYQGNTDELDHIVRHLLEFNQSYSNGKNIIHIAAEAGRVEGLKYALKCKPDLINSSDEKGWNALHYAAESGSVPAVTYLVKPDIPEENSDSLVNGIKYETKTSDGDNILHIAAKKGNTELVKYILHQYGEILFVTNQKGWNALHCASKKGDVDLIEILIQSDFSLTATIIDGKNIVHIAAYNGNMEVVKYITENHKDLIQTVDNKGWNALQIAAQKQSLPVIKMLIDAGLKLETRITNGSNGLHIATSNGNMEVVRYITENYKDLIHTVHNDGYNALHFASIRQNIDMIKMLIEAGLKPETRTTDGENILHIAANNGNMEVVRYIIENNKDVIHTIDNDGWNALHYASQEQNIDFINVLIDAGLKPEARTTDGENILHIAARNGNTEVVRYIIENYKDVIHTVDNDGWNALHYASQEQNIDFIHVLIEAGLTLETRTTDGDNILHIAVRNGNTEVVKYIIQNYKDVIHTVVNNGWNALHYASQEQSVDMLSLLIEAGLKPDKRTTDGKNILHIAARNGNIDVVRYVTDNNKDLIQTVDNDEWNALRYALEKQSKQMIKMLIEAGLNPETMATDGSNILHIAASNGNMEVVRYVTENYKDLINTVDNDGWNALHLASHKQPKQMVILLIEAGLKPETTNSDGLNILHIAASNGNMEVVRYVTENYKDLIHTVENNGWNVLHYAAKAQSVQMINVLIDAGLKPETRTTVGLNILHITTGNGNMEVVRYITENHKDLIQTVDNKGWNALQIAAQKQSLPVIKMLIDAGLKLETRITNGSNGLHIAASNGNMEVVRYITENHKDLIHTVHNDGYNALHFASIRQNIDMIKMLIEAGLKPETRTTDGENILHIAANNGNTEVVRYIIENYKDVIHTIDNDGWNALHYASQEQNIDSINVLIDAGLKPEARTTDGENILHIAVRNGNTEVVRYIIENYKDVIHTVDNDGWNALHYASQEQNIDFINVLIDAGLKPEARTTDGENILHIAVRNGNTEVVKYIIQNYKDVIHTVVNNGWNALHYASHEQSVDMLSLLIEAGLKPDKRTTDGKNILHIAARNGNMDVVRYVTDNNKDLIQTVDNDGWNALHLVSQKQPKQMMILLIEAGLKPETTNSDVLNILHIAASNGNMEVVRYITENYKDLINTVDNDGLNALHLASREQSVDMIKMLIKAGLKPETRTTNGSNILHIAARNWNMEVVKYIIENYKDLIHTVNNYRSNALHCASAKQSVQLINVLIDAGLNPETRIMNGSNILHIEAALGNMEVIRYVNEHYKDLIHTIDNNGCNALQYASLKQNIDFINILIDAGLKPETRTTDGSNILHIAARNGNMEVVRYVTENYKELINTVDNDGWNALHYASVKQSVIMLNVLIEAGLKPETRITNGNNILHIAAGNGNMEVVRYITENYKDLIHTVDNNGWTALHVASRRQNTDMIKMLIEAGLKPEARTTDGENILHIAVNNGNMEVVRYIIENYKDVIHTVDNDGWNALHFASQEQNIDFIDVLIDAGLKPETRTTDGENILHIAAEYGNMEIVRYVIENYKDLIHSVDNDGTNALHLASLEQSVDMIKMLIEAGLKPETRTTHGSTIFHFAAGNGNMEVVRYIRENYNDIIHR